MLSVELCRLFHVVCPSNRRISRPRYLPILVLQLFHERRVLF